MITDITVYLSLSAYGSCPAVPPCFPLVPCAFPAGIRTGFLVCYPVDGVPHPSQSLAVPNQAGKNALDRADKKTSTHFRECLSCTLLTLRELRRTTRGLETVLLQVAGLRPLDFIGFFEGFLDF